MQKLSSLILLFVLTAGMCFAQNVGYRGKKNAIGLGLRLNNYNNPEKTHPEPQIFIERSLTSVSSISFKASLQHFRMYYEDDNISIINFREIMVGERWPEVDLSVYSPMTGKIAGKIYSTSLSYRRYILGLGAIAPMGPFYEAGFTGNFVNITDTKAKVYGKYNYDYFEANLLHVQRDALNFDFGFHARCGEKVFIGKSQFLEYSVGLSLDGMTEEINGVNNHMKAAHYIVKRHYLIRSFIHLNLIYGFGI